MASNKIDQIEGIGLAFAGKLAMAGIKSTDAELLEAAGVDTVKELQHRNPQNLTEKGIGAPKCSLRDGLKGSRWRKGVLVDGGGVGGARSVWTNVGISWCPFGGRACSRSS